MLAASAGKDAGARADRTGLSQTSDNREEVRHAVCP